MKILFVDINARFVNPTRNLLPVAVASAAPTVFFGPGHVSSETLAAGLAAFAEKRGPFDLALASTHVLFARPPAPLPSLAQFRRFYAFDFDAGDVLHLPAIAEDFAALPAKRVACLFESDFYNWNEREIALLETMADYMIGPGAEFTMFWGGDSALAGEAFAAKVTNCWPDYVHAHKERIASLPHFVGPEEFSFRPTDEREAVWSVMGVQYDARARARDALRHAGIRIGREGPGRPLLALAKRARLIAHEREWMQGIINRDFRRRLAASRYAFTCGSALDMAIRKYFEIPAAGTVLACRPFTGFEEAGFRHGENAFVCSPEDLPALHGELEAAPERAAAIAASGRDLVLRRHSAMARARQLAPVLAAMADGSFAGASWQNGAFLLRRRLAGGVAEAEIGEAVSEGRQRDRGALAG